MMALAADGCKRLLASRSYWIGLGGQLKTGNLWTGQNRQFPARPRPV